jgi:hypothetical protein
MNPLSIGGVFMRAAFVAAAVWVSIAGVSDAAPSETAWTPATSASMREFVLGRHWHTNPKSRGVEDAAFVVAPDASHFFLVTSRGDVASDSVIHELHVYQSKAVKDALARAKGSSAIEPWTSVRFVSYSSSDLTRGINVPRWGAEGRSILFQGIDRENQFHIYRLDLGSKVVERLTRLPGRLSEDFHYDADGTLRFRRLVRGDRAPLGYPFETADRDERGEVIEPRWHTEWVPHVSMPGPDGERIERRADASEASAGGPTETNAVPVTGFSLALRQGTNEPPVPVAFDGNREIALLPPDLALQGVRYAKQQPFSWHEGAKKVTGGLRLPHDYEKGTRVPLVIQAYVYHPDLFEPDGPHTGTSDAAQTLAARGFAVLQIDLSKTPLEGPGLVARVDAAVDALVKEGIVDPERVGMTGFSRGGYGTLYTITHPARTRIAAAVCADSFDGGFVRYITEHYTSDAARPGWSYGTITSGHFWEHKADWLEHETLFNVDRVRTPALFTRHGKGVPDWYRDYSLPMIGAFTLNRKPIEYLYFPHGSHSLIRPRERIALQAAVVEWMSFWLQGVLPPDAQRAARWAKLRENR